MAHTANANESDSNMFSKNQPAFQPGNTINSVQEVGFSATNSGFAAHSQVLGGLRMTETERQYLAEAALASDDGSGRDSAGFTGLGQRPVGGTDNEAATEFESLIWEDFENFVGYIFGSGIPSHRELAVPSTSAQCHNQV